MRPKQPSSNQPSSRGRGSRGRVAGTSAQPCPFAVGTCLVPPCSLLLLRRWVGCEAPAPPTSTYTCCGCNGHTHSCAQTNDLILGNSGGLNEASIVHSFCQLWSGWPDLLQVGHHMVHRHRLVHVILHILQLKLRVLIRRPGPAWVGNPVLQVRQHARLFLLLLLLALLVLTHSCEHSTAHQRQPGHTGTHYDTDESAHPQLV
mmetsp:Transcript_2228/g.5661  ORF Transcript_2228/g.5661 Transcript_2228/m.5661 type:complete len:203 (+) Transcript_2228:835-1443(+)